ncbi:hypothetical protein IFR04_003129 [Cadophora malorum]|uniref:Uncharacterized protein n=1 Tax=Cadophora malorum TaxID=108018 RepID=A0A8H7WF32_9HELO|nr:hypothetical protein IFR04_003129 [Cadophora malorum]
MNCIVPIRALTPLGTLSNSFAKVQDNQSLLQRSFSGGFGEYSLDQETKNQVQYVEQKLLYHYLLDLEEGPLESKHDPRLLCANDLDLLLGFIRTGYSPTTERLVPVLEQHQITYDLLWTLFKPNGLAHTKCFGTG